MRSVVHYREHIAFSPTVRTGDTVFYHLWDRIPALAALIADSFSENTSVVKTSIAIFCLLSLVGETVMSVNSIF